MEIKMKEKKRKKKKKEGRRRKKSLGKRDGTLSWSLVIELHRVIGREGPELKVMKIESRDW